MKSKMIGVVLALLATLAAIAPTQADAQSMLPFAPLTGLYQVGQADFEMLDATRPEVFSDATDDRRRLLVSFYYPASVPADAKHGPYVSIELSTAARMPQQVQDQQSAGFANVAIADGNFPVLIFSPAAGTHTLYYSSLLNQLASQGYVVAAIWHPYTTRRTLFPDGTLLESNAAGSITGESLDEQLASLEHVGKIWVEDQRFVLTTMELWNDDHPLFKGHLDLSKVGAFGHSFGGATALETAYQDERFDAALNMDGTMFGTAAIMGSRVPFLLLRGDPPAPTAEQLAEFGETRTEFDAEEQLKLDAINQVIANSENASILKLANSRHNAYVTDNLFFSPLIPPEQKLTLIGAIDPMVAYQQIVTWVSDFMAMHVK